MKHGRISKKARQRELLIIAMLQQPTLEKAAAAVGISATTAWRISKTAEYFRKTTAAPAGMTSCNRSGGYNKPLGWL